MKRVAVITGAGGGIGSAIARMLRTEADELWLIGRNEKKLRALAEEVAIPAVVFPGDVTEDRFYTDLENALKNDVSVTMLVCSAGFGDYNLFADQSLDVIAETVDVNCKALTCITRVVLPYLASRASVLEIASGAGFLPQPGFSVYAASKAYVIHFSRALRQELRKRKIRVTAVCPGPVDTDFFARLDHVPAYKKRRLISPAKVAKNALRAVRHNRAIASSSFSILGVRILTHVVPTSWILRFYK